MLLIPHDDYGGFATAGIVGSQWLRSTVVVGLLVVFGMVVWGAATLVIDISHRLCHRQPDLADQLAAYQPPSIADEARQWLDSQV